MTLKDAFAKRTAAIVLAIAAPFGLSACGTTKGLPTAGGAVIGGVLGNKIGGKGGAAIGAVVGAGIGNALEPDCTTRVASTVSRSVNGNNTGTWRGGETMRTDCNYSGKTSPGNFNAPQHLEHMQGNGTSKFRPNN